MKLISNSLLAALLIATLVWGGCLSCPRFFMFSNQEDACCKKSTECERPMQHQPAKADCTKLAFGLGSDDIYPPAIAFVALAFDVPVHAVVPARGMRAVEAESPQHSPPALFLKNRALLI